MFNYETILLLLLALFLISITPPVYVLFYQIGCDGKCAKTEQPQAPISLYRLDSEYAEKLNLVFCDLVRVKQNATALSQKFTEMMVAYQDERAAWMVNVEEDLNATSKNEVERLLLLQQFIIDFANDPDSTEMKADFQSYGSGPLIGLKPSCLVPYPNATELVEMYYTAIYLKLTDCVIEAYEAEHYREEAKREARITAWILSGLAGFWLCIDVLMRCLRACA